MANYFKLTPPITVSVVPEVYNSLPEEHILRDILKTKKAYTATMSKEEDGLIAYKLLGKNEFIQIDIFQIHTVLCTN